jgi:hypothetical protein
MLSTNSLNVCQIREEEHNENVKTDVCVCVHEANLCFVN